MRALARTMKGVGLALFTCLSAGCGEDPIDLDNTVQTQGLPEGVLVRQRNSIMAFGVGTDRVFWATPDEVRSCLKSDCASSLVTYASKHTEYPFATRFLAQRGSQLIWASELGVFWSPVDGSQGPEQLGEGKDGFYVLADDALLALSHDGLYELRLTARSWVRLRRLADGVRTSFAEHAGYVYWLEQSPSSGTSRIIRASRDPEKALEVVAAEGLHASGGAQLAFEDDFVYFPDSRQAGAICRCPLTGCAGEPEPVLAPVRAPVWLRLDDNGLCVGHERSSFDLEVACAARGSQRLAPRFNYVSSSSFAMDSDSVYAVHWLSADTTVGSFVDIERASR